MTDRENAAPHQDVWIAHPGGAPGGPDLQGGRLPSPRCWYSVVGMKLSVEEHSSRVSVSLDGGSEADIIVVAFPVVTDD
jgi:hypothetical protein